MERNQAGTSTRKIE